MGEQTCGLPSGKECSSPQTLSGYFAPPDFGRVLSNDRFTRIMRYLARGPDGTETLKQGDPWAEIRWMVDGLSATRKSQFKCGWIVTPDESMAQ